MQPRPHRLRQIRKLGMSIAALVALTTLGGCFHVSHRALTNGAALSNNNADASSFMYGDHSFRRMRSFQSSMNILGSHNQQVRYPFRGEWY